MGTPWWQAPPPSNFWDWWDRWSRSIRDAFGGGGPQGYTPPVGGGYPTSGDLGYWLEHPVQGGQPEQPADARTTTGDKGVEGTYIEGSGVPGFGLGDDAEPDYKMQNRFNWRKVLYPGTRWREKGERVAEEEVDKGNTGTGWDRGDYDPTGRGFYGKTDYYNYVPTYGYVMLRDANGNWYRAPNTGKRRNVDWRLGNEGAWVGPRRWRQLNQQGRIKGMLDRTGKAGGPRAQANRADRRIALARKWGQELPGLDDDNRVPSDGDDGVPGAGTNLGGELGLVNWRP